MRNQMLFNTQNASVTTRPSVGAGFTEELPAIKLPVGDGKSILVPMYKTGTLL
jgi:hypothetical protein